MKTELSVGDHTFELPLEICNTLQALGKSDAEIYVMTPRERFAAWCDYEGLIFWGDRLWDLVKESLECKSSCSK